MCHSRVKGRRLHSDFITVRGVTQARKGLACVCIQRKRMGPPWPSPGSWEEECAVRKSEPFAFCLRQYVGP